MLARKPEIEQALIPELDASVVAHQHLQILKNERAHWRCLLVPSLISIGFHMFLLPLLMVITVTFADQVVNLSTWEASADQLGDNTVGEIDFEREPDLAQSEEESTVSISSDEITVATGETKPADLLFSELSWDFGTVERGPVLKHEFRVKNNSGTAIDSITARVS
jgi:hypothetical protein